MNRCVIPISGGMDSTVILHYAKKHCKFDEIYAVTFYYGQRHSCEIECAVKQATEVGVTSHKIIDVSFFKDIVTTSSLTNSDIAVANTRESQGHPQTVNYVPFRNMMLLSIALAHAESVGASTVFHGAAQLDTLAGFWDGSPEFLAKINQIAALNRKVQIQIEAPLIDLPKRSIILLGKKLGVNFANTHTCYNPIKKQEWNGNYTAPEGPVEIIACGECTACGGRIKGFMDADLVDPLKYNVNIPW